MAIGATGAFALGSARRERRVLKLAPAFISATQLSEILFKPEAVQHVGDRGERNAGITAFDGTQRRSRHSRALGQEQRGQPAPPARQTNVLPELR
jgi:hypothetical protein